MINLSKRSYQPEILDGDNIPFTDIRQNMRELNTINSLLGGHAITISGIKKIIPLASDNTYLTICEIGCGGGDNLQAINNWCNKNNIAVKFIGIDIKPACISFAQQQYPLLNCQWIPLDYQQVIFSTAKPDIIFSSLFCHHFPEQQIVQMLQWMKIHATKGFFINDLHRHKLAYYSIKLITYLFSRSYLVKNDAPLSVARGFVAAEWHSIFNCAQIINYKLYWKWAFRYLIIYIHD